MFCLGASASLINWIENGVQRFTAASVSSDKTKAHIEKREPRRNKTLIELFLVGRASVLDKKYTR